MKLNQRKGFDCPGCAWPETPGHRKHAEFCENGAKAVAEEATTAQGRRRDFFAAHSVAELLGQTDYWLGQQGRLTQPMVLRPGATHYEPIGWDDGVPADRRRAAGAGVARRGGVLHLRAHQQRGGVPYQLLVRAFGTNNLPDCSNMCHESSGRRWSRRSGSARARCRFADLEDADLILIAGQNPGTNHPRMLSALEKAKRNGAKVIAINPLPEAGLLRFKDPQKVHGVVGARRRRSPTSSCRSGSAATWRCSRGSAGCCSRPRTQPRAPCSTARSSTQHCAGFDEYAAAHPQRRPGRRGRGDRADARADRDDRGRR